VFPRRDARRMVTVTISVPLMTPCSVCVVYLMPYTYVPHHRHYIYNHVWRLSYIRPAMLLWPLYPHNYILSLSSVSHDLMLVAL
jgi:hypothetical protein